MLGDIEICLIIDDVEVIVNVDYIVTYWGSPATGPDSRGPGYPAEIPEFEITSIYNNNKNYKWNELSKDNQDEIYNRIYEDIHYKNETPDYPEFDYD